MDTLYAIVAGPLVWIAFVLFFGGLLYKLVRMIVQVYRKERFIFSYMSLKFALRSIGHWIVPFGTVNWRRHPVVTSVTFCFHLCLIITPLFLSAHYVLLDDSLGLNWWVLPNGVADLMTLVVVAACIFFLVRRAVQREVRFVTRISDYLLLLLVMLPFVSGLLTYHQLGKPVVGIIIHMLSAEILLVVIPFSRLSHMIFSIFTRSYIGSEFGKVRKARDW